MKAVYCFWKTNIFLRYSVQCVLRDNVTVVERFFLRLFEPPPHHPYTHTHTQDIAQEATLPHSVPCFPQSQIRVFSLRNIFSLGSPLSRGTPVRLKISASPSLTSMPVSSDWCSFLWECLPSSEHQMPMWSSSLSTSVHLCSWLLCF